MILPKKVAYLWNHYDNIESHRIIDIIPSREIEDVAEWLSSFPNLEIVSRHSSVSYNNVIKQIIENGHTFKEIA